MSYGPESSNRAWRLYESEKTSVVLGESTAFHETVPGHHLQINIANARVQAAAGPSAFSSDCIHSLKPSKRCLDFHTLGSNLPPICARSSRAIARSSARQAIRAEKFRNRFDFGYRSSITGTDCWSRSIFPRRTVVLNPTLDKMKTSAASAPCIRWRNSGQIIALPAQAERLHRAVEKFARSQRGSSQPAKLIVFVPATGG